VDQLFPSVQFSLSVPYSLQYIYKIQIKIYIAPNSLIKRDRGAKPIGLLPALESAGYYSLSPLDISTPFPILAPLSSLRSCRYCWYPARGSGKSCRFQQVGQPNGVLCWRLPKSRFLLCLTHSGGAVSCNYQFSNALERSTLDTLGSWFPWHKNSPRVQRRQQSMQGRSLRPIYSCKRTSNGCCNASSISRPVWAGVAGRLYCSLLKAVVPCQNKIILQNFRPEPPPSVNRPKIMLFQHGTTSKIILKNFMLFQCFILTWNRIWNEIR